MDFCSALTSPQLILLTIIGLSFWSPMECVALRLFRGAVSSSSGGAKAYFSQEEEEELGGGDDDGEPASSRTTAGQFWELVSSSSDIIPVQNRSSSDLPPSSSSSVHISLETRLQKLEHHFNTLKIYDEDCRQRLLCNLAENPKKFAPLSTALLDETSYIGDEKVLATALLSTKEGARLLSYIEAVQKGSSRFGCDVWTYRCPLSITAMIDYKALLVWKELSKWLTVKFVASKRA
ncbi:uncharacterized protein LOC110856893 isoform X1 [Folsomia candida]|nr:uncharacterized protein LOC110856893 isoform X1 [Folsomia candida]